MYFLPQKQQDTQYHNSSAGVRTNPVVVVHTESC